MCRTSAVHAACRWGQRTTQSSKWLPRDLNDVWGPLLCFSLMSVALMADSYFLHPLQLCMRSPVLPVWDGTLRHFLGAHSKRLLVWALRLPPDRFVDPPVLKPQHYQRTMYNFEEEEAAGEAERNAKVLQAFADSGGAVLQTDAGKRYLRTEGNDLQEIVFDVRPARGAAAALAPGEQPQAEPPCPRMQQCGHVNARMWSCMQRADGVVLHAGCFWIHAHALPAGSTLCDDLTRPSVHVQANNNPILKDSAAVGGAPRQSFAGQGGAGPRRPSRMLSAARRSFHTDTDLSASQVRGSQRGCASVVCATFCEVLSEFALCHSSAQCGQEPLPRSCLLVCFSSASHIQ